MIKNKNFLQSFCCAVRGLGIAIQTQRNLRFHICAAAAVLICSGICQTDRVEQILLILTIGMVIAAELLNSSLENAVDLVTEEYNEYAKRAKDIAAGGVLIAAAAAVAVGIMVFCDAERIRILMEILFGSWIAIAGVVLYAALSLIFIFYRKN